MHKLNLPLTDKRHLFAIKNPTNDLDDLLEANIEVEIIAANFQPNYILKHNAATKAKLFEKNLVGWDLIVFIGNNKYTNLRCF